MSWKGQIAKNNSSISKALTELMGLNGDAMKKYAELSNNIIPQENKSMIDAEMSDIASALLDLQKAYSRLGWALDRQEKEA